MLAPSQETSLKRYQITRKFTSGLLKGLTYTEITGVLMPVGFKCDFPIGGSPYSIISCREVK